MSRIEWTQRTWNPTLGCSRVSAGCEHCYAETQVHRGMIDRHKGLTVLPRDKDGKSLGKGPRWTGEVRMVPEVLGVPLRRRKATAWFVNSLSDLFHERLVDNEEGRQFIAAIFGVMASTPQHTYQVLTKRPEKAHEWFEWLDAQARVAEDVFPCDTMAWRRGHCLLSAAIRSGLHVGPVVEAWPLPNVWLGTSVEDRRAADSRVPELLRLPAAVRWLSCEPLLEAITLEATSLGEVDWVVVGGESGPKARRCEVRWIRSLLDQCAVADVPVFVKQMGSCSICHEPFDMGEDAYVRWDASDDGNQPMGPSGARAPYRHSKGGDPSEWDEGLRVRQYPRCGFRGCRADLGHEGLHLAQDDQGHAFFFDENGCESMHDEGRPSEFDPGPRSCGKDCPGCGGDR